MEEKSKIPSEYIFGIKVFIVLYALTPFVPRFETIDPIGSHWLYIGILNVFGLLFIFKINSVGLLKQVLGSHKAIYVYGAFIIIAVFSLFNSINVFEGVRVGARIITSFIALVILYHLLKIATSTIFKFIAQTLIVVLFLVAVQVVFHFVSNWDTPRFTSLLKHSELLFGNRNITSASISILIPFVYGGYQF